MMKSRLFLRLFAVLSALFIGGGILAQNQTFTVSGTVIDDKGAPIAGVGITVPGTTVGTATNGDGTYTINVPANATLNFSFIGYTPVTVAVGNQTRIDVTMSEDVLKIDDVVVVGYGTLTKRSVTTAISSVEGSKFADMPVNNVAQGMVGLVSGVTFQQISGQPGEAPAIRIRGAGSINNSNDPLFVIDGYPTDDSELFVNLSPGDIQSIDILKDAASAAIYGSRAGNGVIIVTTKHGQSGKPNIRFDALIGIDQPMKYLDVLNRDQFVDMVKEARANQGMDPLPMLENPSLLPDTDWQKLIFRNALTQRYNLSVNGGSDKMRYAFSASYQDQEGILLNSFNNRISVKGSFDVNLSKYVKIGVSFSPTYSKTRSQDPTGGNTSITSGAVADALSMPPIYEPYLENGDYFQIIQHASETGFNVQLLNPLSKLNEIKNDRTAIRTRNQAYIEIKPIKGLVLNSSFNFSSNSSKQEYYVTAYNPGSDRSGNKSTPNLAAIDAYRRSGFGYNVYWSSTANYSFTLGNDHNFVALLGYDVAYDSGFSVRQDDRTDSDFPIAYDNTTITNVNGALLYNGSSSFDEYAFDAVFGRLNYDYKGKYLVSGSVRRDRSSKFGADNRSGIFWSASAAWNLAEESWLQGQKSWLSMAKIRASYGVTGNDRIGNNYAWLSSMNKDHHVIFGQGTDASRVTAYYPDGYSNSQLGWEKNRQWDLGFDIGLFRRVNINIDLYKRNSNVIMNASIPNFNGKSGSIMMNAGEVQNKGLEFNITSPILVKNFKWTSNLNFSMNRNKIISLADGMTQLANGRAGAWSNVIRNYVGRPMGDMYMYIVEGTFNTEEDLANYAKKGSQGLGDLRFKDVDKNGSIDVNDMEYVGNYQPKLTFGFSNQFSYKNFDFSFVLDGQVGGKIIFGIARPISLNRWMENALTISAENRWRSPEDPGNGKSHKAGSANMGSNIDASTRFLYKSDFLRIRNVSLGYTVPERIVKKLGLKGVRFNITAQNLHMFTEYPGYSPEANQNGNSATNNGVDFGCYPIARSITFGANFSF